MTERKTKADAHHRTVPSAAEQRAKIAEQRRQNTEVRGRGGPGSRFTRGGRVLERRYREYRDYSRDYNRGTERQAWYIDNGRGPHDGHKRGPNNGPARPPKRGRRDPETVQRDLDHQLDAYLDRSGSEGGAKAQQRTTRAQKMLNSLNPESITPEQLKKREERFAAYLKPEKDEAAEKKEAAPKSTIVPPEIAEEYQRALEKENKCPLTSPEALERRKQRFAQPTKPEEDKAEPAADAAGCDAAATAAAGEEAEAKSGEAAAVEGKKEDNEAAVQEEKTEPELEAEDTPAAAETSDVELVDDASAEGTEEKQQEQPSEPEEKQQQEEEPAAPKAAAPKKKKVAAKKPAAKKAVAAKKGAKAAATKKAKAAQGDSDDVMILP